MTHKLLVIDDDIIIVNPVKKFFKIRNFYVISAQTGKEGLKKFKSEKPNIVLVDLNLPDIKGEEIVKEIRKTDKEIIIIVITGYGSIQSAVNLFKLGINDYILKPFEMEELYLIIEKILQHKK